MTDADHSSDEEIFLHELANPLAVAFGNIEVVLSKVGSPGAQLPVEFLIDRITRAHKALTAVTHLVESRRLAVRGPE